MSFEDLGERLKRIEIEGMPKPKPITSHELAKKLLAFPDQEITIVKGEGGGYFTEYRLNPGGPWIDLSGKVRMQIERIENGVSAT